MQLVTPENALDYLRAHGRIRPETPATVRWLAWGVSNVVLRVEPEGEPAFVVKQSREQLRTKADWFSRLDRIWREIDVMRTLHPLLPAGSVPRVLFEDRANYLFGMEAVDVGHVVWKGELLDGTADPQIAATSGRILSALHRESAGSDDLRRLFGDREVFDQLRLDPFYRYVAARHDDLRPHLERVIDETMACSDCLVHADFSPKNLLIVRRPDGRPQVALVDYETGHYGDPAFDLGFFLSHLLLKTVRFAERQQEYLALSQTFWREYVAGLGAVRSHAGFGEGELDRRAIGHLAGCLLARIDGKSTIDYLPEASQQDEVRQFARGLLTSPPATMIDVFSRFADE